MVLKLGKLDEFRVNCVLFIFVLKGEIISILDHLCCLPNLWAKKFLRPFLPVICWSGFSVTTWQASSPSQQTVLNISSLVKDSSYFAYIVTNSIGCVHVLEENRHRLYLFWIWKTSRLSLIKTPQTLWFTRSVLLSKVHNRAVVWHLCVL